MKKPQVIEMFCRLSAKVGDEVFHNQHAYDCFCGHSPDNATYAFSDEVMRFILEAVKEKMVRENTKVANNAYDAKKTERFAMNNESPLVQIEWGVANGEKVSMIKGFLRLVKALSDGHVYISLVDAKTEVERVFDFESKQFKVDSWNWNNLYNIGRKNNGEWVWNQWLKDHADELKEKSLMPAKSLIG